MVMSVCVDIAPGMYPVGVLVVCSLCYIVVPTIWRAPSPHCAQLVRIPVARFDSARVSPPMGLTMEGRGHEYLHDV